MSLWIKLLQQFSVTGYEKVAGGRRRTKKNALLLKKSDLSILAVGAASLNTTNLHHPEQGRSPGRPAW